MTRYDVLTLHPNMVEGPLSESIVGRARTRGLVNIQVHDIREHGLGKHRTVDDTPYGGGPGMVMRVDVVAAALESVTTEESIVLLMTPTGRVFNQRLARELSTKKHLVLICGHYEGIDDRIGSLVDQEISLGDFVMTGGELAALAIIDSVVRLQPGVLGNENSAEEESFSNGLLEHPQYTRPRIWRDKEVPEVLLSGHHGKIEEWRNTQQLLRTKLRRPDLFGSEKDAESHEIAFGSNQIVDESPDVE